MTYSALMVILFIIALPLPITFDVGTLRLSPYRLFLVLAFIPLVLAWLSGRAGRVRAPDLLIVFFVLWSAIAVSVNHGVADAVVPTGILAIETVGAYLLARCLVRDAAGFKAMVRALFVVVLVLLPFAVYEAVAKQSILLSLFGTVFPVLPQEHGSERWGLKRVQGPFEHPILFGVFCSSACALSIYVLGYNRRLWAKWWRSSLVIATVFLSLSSGPLTAVLAQGAAAVWERLTRRIANRWTILFSGFALAYVVVDILSNRSPIRVFISYTAFDPVTAYSRLNIWEYGSAEVLRNPVFGIGFHDWIRLPFMTASVDMFWLLNAMRYGLPAALAISLAVLIIIVQLGRRKLTDDRLASYRLGLVITLVGFVIVGWTVHFWNAIYCLFMFLLGSGVWMLDQPGQMAVHSQLRGDGTKRQTGRQRMGPVRTRGS